MAPGTPWPLALGPGTRLKNTVKILGLCIVEAEGSGCFIIRETEVLFSNWKQTLETGSLVLFQRIEVVRRGGGNGLQICLPIPCDQASSADLCAQQMPQQSLDYRQVYVICRGSMPGTPTDKENSGCWKLQFSSPTLPCPPNPTGSVLQSGLEVFLYPTEAARVCPQLLQASEGGLETKTVTSSFSAKPEVTFICL